jgi:hypothetical protein
MSWNAESKTNLMAFPFPRLPGVQEIVKGLLLKIRLLGQSLRTPSPCIQGSFMSTSGPSQSLPSSRTRCPLIPLILHIIPCRAAGMQGIQIPGTWAKAGHTHPHHPPHTRNLLPGPRLTRERRKPPSTMLKGIIRQLHRTRRTIPDGRTILPGPRLPRQRRKPPSTVLKGIIRQCRRTRRTIPDGRRPPPALLRALDVCSAPSTRMRTNMGILRTTYNS